MRLISYLFLLTYLSKVFAEYYSCPNGRTKKVITLEKDDILNFEINPGYKPKLKCSITYKPGKSKCKLSLSCPSFALPNKDVNKCRKGDKLRVGKQIFCNDQSPATVGKDFLKLTFLSHKATKSNGVAKCKVECLEAVPLLTGKLNNYSTKLFMDSYYDNLGQLVKKLKEELVSSNGTEPITSLISLSLSSVVEIVAAPGHWKKSCHMHPSSASLQVLEGEFSFKSSANKAIENFKAGGQVFVQKFNPHAESNPNKEISVYLINWSPVPNRTELTIPLDESLCSSKEFPDPQVPPLKNLTRLDTTLPDEWSAVAFLHPYSQVQCCYDYTDEQLSNPFFPFAYDITKAALKGTHSRIEMYLKTCNNSTELWLEQNESGTFFKNCSSCDLNPLNLNWTMPESDWLKDKKDLKYEGSAPLNWMNPDKIMDWYKATDESKSANSIWYWYERNEAKNKSTPFRLMYSVPPTTSVLGSSMKLPLFQMFSFSYIAFDEQYDSEPLNKVKLNSKLEKYGFQCQNDDNWPLFEWPDRITFSSMDIPVDAGSNPVPTKVTYQWKNDLSAQSIPSDRIQITRLNFNSYNNDNYNPNYYQEAVMLGPNCVQGEPLTGRAFIVSDRRTDWTSRCHPLDLGQQSPNWPQKGQGKIHAVIKKPANSGQNWISPFTGSNNSVALISVLFPPTNTTVFPQYPDSTFLWTWYDYSLYEDKFSDKFSKARPITFMQSAPGIGVGTNLALADYFDYYEVHQPFPNINYTNLKMDRACNATWDKPKGPNETLTDYERAVEKVPRMQYKGTNFTSMSNALNMVLKSSYPNNTKECQKWTVQELHRFQEEVFSMRETTMQFIYSESSDSRKISHCKINDIKESWNKSIQAATSCNLENVLRDGHCHEAVMWFTHHLTKENRDLMRNKGTVIPLLSTIKHTFPESPTECQQQIQKTVNEKIKCTECHITKVGGQCPVAGNH